MANGTAGSSAAIAALRPRERAGMMETAPSPAFATLLRRYRQAAGLSQEELAARARLNARTVGDLERGVSHAPRKDTVERLAQALDLGVPQRAALAGAARWLSTSIAAWSRSSRWSTCRPRWLCLLPAYNHTW
jgi:DNA-binding XRE family transcriptional regulator